MDGGSRKANWTESEISLLVEQVEQKKEVLKGKFSPSLSATDKSEAWAVITDSINAIGGCGRTLKEVKKKWQDIQSAAKTREVGRLKTQRLTGGGPPPSEIKDWEKKIIGIMSTSVITGITGGCDSLVTDSERAIYPIQPSTCTSLQSSEAATDLDTNNPEDEQFETVVFKNPDSCSVPVHVPADVCCNKFNKKQTKNLRVQDKAKGDASELLCIQREMLELMKQDVAIKQKMLQTFEEFVACKKRKLDLQEENAKGQTYFDL